MMHSTKRPPYAGASHALVIGGSLFAAVVLTPILVPALGLAAFFVVPLVPLFVLAALPTFVGARRRTRKHEGHVESVWDWQLPLPPHGHDQSHGGAA